nr:hypothetical protein [Streptomyces sp. NBRC 13847]
MQIDAEQSFGSFEALQHGVGVDVQALGGPAEAAVAVEPLKQR